MLFGGRFRLLLATWGTYWAALVVFALGPMALAILRATTAPSDHKNSVNLAFGNGVFDVKVVYEGQTTYTSSVHFLTAALWIAGPPLIAWLIFAFGAGREAERV